MNTAQGFFLISLLLITALLALTVLLIIVTEQSDGALEGRRRIVISSRFRGGTAAGTFGFPRRNGKITRKLPADSDDGGESEEAPTTATTISPAPVLLIGAELEKLAEFGPSDGGKFVGIQLVGKSLLLPKDDGRIEVRNSENLSLTRTVNTGIRIHRAKSLNERTIVVLEGTFKRMILFDLASGTQIGERRLTEPAKEMAVDNRTVYTLGRFVPNLNAFDLNDLSPSAEPTIALDDRNCNFVSGDNTNNALLISCGPSILRISKIDGLSRRFSSSGVNYSALLAVRAGIFMAVNKAQREVHLFSEHNNEPIAQLRHHSGGIGRSIWIWTSLALDPRNGTLFALEYISNRIEVFRVPPNLMPLLL